VGWSKQSGNFIGECKTGNEIILDNSTTQLPLKFIPNSNKLMVINNATVSLEIWDLTTKKHLYTFGNRHLINSEIMYSPNGSHIAFVLPESNFFYVNQERIKGSIFIFNTTNGTIKEYPEIFEKLNELKLINEIPDYAFSSDGKYLILIGSQKQITILDLATDKITEYDALLPDQTDYAHAHECLINLDKHYMTLCNPVYSKQTTDFPDEKLQSRLYLWDKKTLKTLKPIPFDFSKRGFSQILATNNTLLLVGLDNENNLFITKITPDQKTLDTLPLEYALKDAESKDDNESRIKAQQLRTQIKKFSGESDKSDKSEE
jgi:WD40 repeat protein